MNHECRSEQDAQFILHIAGPDDVMEFADEIEALKEANAINKLYLQKLLEMGDNTPLLLATVTRKSESNEI